MKIPIRILYFLSALYILVPLIIFAFGWLHLPLALCILGIFFSILYRILKEKKGSDSIIISYYELGIVLVGIVIWTVLSGAGHRGFADGDGYKHNAILNDLISYNWPVLYQPLKSKELVYLCYYFAFYLPASLVGKFLGWKMANIFLFGWTMYGVILSATWFLAICKKGHKSLYLLFFIFFGGLDALGRLIMRDKVVNGTDWEWWARNWQYSGNTTLLFYVPQHALIGWILTGIIMYGFLNKKAFPFFIALLFCVPLWSPFVFLGLLPFSGIYLYQNRKSASVIECVLAIVFLSFQLFFFASNLTFLVKETGVSAWLWQVEKISHSWVLLRLFLFYLFEFGFFAFFIFLFKPALKGNNRKVMFVTSFIILLMLPWYKMGLLNDFVMRVSIPALWILGFFWIESIMNQKNKKIIIIAMIIFIIGGIYPTRLFIRGITHFSWGPPKASLTTYEDPTFRKQYLGYGKSIFFTYFAPHVVSPKIGIMKYK